MFYHYCNKYISVLADQILLFSYRLVIAPCCRGRFPGSRTGSGPWAVILIEKYLITIGINLTRHCPTSFVFGMKEPPSLIRSGLFLIVFHSKMYTKPAARWNHLDEVTVRSVLVMPWRTSPFAVPLVVLLFLPPILVLRIMSICLY